MVAHRKAVINSLILLFFLTQKLCDIKMFKWEVNKSIIFIPSQGPCFKPFQCNYQNWWQFVKVQVLSGLHVLLALIAIPCIVLFQLLHLAEQIQTLVQVSVGGCQLVRCRSKGLMLVIQVKILEIGLSALAEQHLQSKPFRVVVEFI